MDMRLLYCFVWHLEDGLVSYAVSTHFKSPKRTERHAEFVHCVCEERADQNALQKVAVWLEKMGTSSRYLSEYMIASQKPNRSHSGPGLVEAVESLHRDMT